MSIIDKVVGSFRKGDFQELNCGDEVEFNTPQGKITLSDADAGKDGFDTLKVVTNDGKIHEYQSSKFPNQFRQLNDYIGKQCSGDREVKVELGHKREHRIRPIALKTPAVEKRSSLDEHRRFERIKAQIRADFKPECISRDDCEILARNVKEAEAPLKRLRTDVDAQLALLNGKEALSPQERADKKAYEELTEAIDSLLTRLDAWTRSVAPQLAKQDLDIDHINIELEHFRNW